MDDVAPAAPPLQWDVFCRVVDNHGDLGVCWRLSRRLAALGQRVRLWIDDAAALAWMAPDGAAGVQVLPWAAALAHETPGDVVVEAFGCDPPPAFVARMAAASRPPVWINLEYLSAEPYVERSHGLRSPQGSGPGAGLDKWFFYPGFSAATGGLLLEDGFDAERATFDPRAWLGTLGIAARDEACRVSLFCYAQPALAAALAGWQREPTQLLVTPGPAAQQVAARLGVPGRPGDALRREALQVHFLPWLTQPDFDRLLWSCDLNCVRGEDSLVRALWAGPPFLWQLYPQDDGADASKLEAFLHRYLDGVETGLAAQVGSAFRGWNGGAAGTPGAPAATPAWQAHARRRRDRLAAEQAVHGDLARRLLGFLDAKRLK